MDIRATGKVKEVAAMLKVIHVREEAQEAKDEARQPQACSGQPLKYETLFADEQVSRCSGYRLASLLLARMGQQQNNGEPTTFLSSEKDQRREKFRPPPRASVGLENILCG